MNRFGGDARDRAMGIGLEESGSVEDVSKIKAAKRCTLFIYS